MKMSKVPPSIKETLFEWFNNRDFVTLNTWEDNNVYYITASITHEKSIDIFFIRIFGELGSLHLSQDRKVTLRPKNLEKHAGKDI